MAEIELKYVNKFYETGQGKLRYVCRPPGHKSKTLEGVKGSEEFMADYHNWLEKAGVRLIGSGRSKPGTLDTAVASYKNRTRS